MIVHFCKDYVKGQEARTIAVLEKDRKYFLFLLDKRASDLDENIRKRVLERVETVNLNKALAKADKMEAKLEKKSFIPMELVEEDE